MSVKRKKNITNNILELDFLPHKAPLLALKVMSPSYNFAFYLNSLYNLKLSRRTDLKLTYTSSKSPSSSLPPVNSPFFSYFDELSQVLYLLVMVPDVYYTQNALSSSFNTYIFFIGSNAATYRDKMFHDIDADPSKLDICDREALQKNSLTNQQFHSVIFMYAYFDFPENAEPRTSYYSEPYTKWKKYLERLKYFTNVVLATAENSLTCKNDTEETTPVYSSFDCEGITLKHSSDNIATLQNDEK